MDLIARPAARSRAPLRVDASSPDDPGFPGRSDFRLPARRDLLRVGALAAATAVMAPSRAMAQGQPRAVPRNRTLVVVWGGREGRWVDHELWNPYAIGANHQNGLGLLYEPLAYYSAFADTHHPWLAASHAYGPGARELTIQPGPASAGATVRRSARRTSAYTLNTPPRAGPQGELGSRRPAVRPGRAGGGSADRPRPVQGPGAALL